MLNGSISCDDNRLHDSLIAEGHVTHPRLSYRFSFGCRCLGQLCESLGPGYYGITVYNGRTPLPQNFQFRIGYHSAQHITRVTYVDICSKILYDA